MRHVTKSLVAGMVAVLPVGGTLLSIVFIEDALATSGIGRLDVYFPGLGILLALVGLYLLGVTVSTVVGRYFYAFVDRLLTRLPGLGFLYRSLKEVLGYGEGEQAIFSKVVLVRNRAYGSACLGLVTNEVEVDGEALSVVYLPHAPSPANGQLHYLPRGELTELDMTTSEALKVLFAVGKIEQAYRLQGEGTAASGT
ncbi:MAG: DUF502 domain-containing protein [Gammaproteobacteria bacterium]|nr:DUF502 domain-containing protein [Gammaproteobacteria bacterium]